MTWFLIQVIKSWQTVWDAPAAATDVRAAVDGLSQWFRHARAFRGKELGRLWYERRR